MAAIEWVLFDLGGPLVRDDGDGVPPLPPALLEELSGQASEADLARRLDEAVRRFAPSPVRAVLWSVCRPDRGRFDGLVGRAAQTIASGEWVPPLRDGVIDVLERLVGGGYRLGLFTSYSPAEQRTILGRHGLERFFPEICAPPFPKSDRRALSAVLEAHGARGENVVVVGDRRDQDVCAARAAGAMSVLVRVGLRRGLAARVPDEEADVEVDDIAQVPEAVASLGTASRPPAPEGLWRSRRCFACGTENHAGLDLAPRLDGQRVVARFVPQPVHRGWSRLVHGGLLATALDEVACLAAAQRLDKKVLTVESSVRYRAPAYLDRTYDVIGWWAGSEGRYELADGEMVDDRGTVVATIRLHCLGVDEGRAAAFLGVEGGDSVDVGDSVGGGETPDAVGGSTTEARRTRRLTERNSG